MNFVGGLLAIGGGMALGRKGPCVQMDVVGARLVGARFGGAWTAGRLPAVRRRRAFRVSS